MPLKCAPCTPTAMDLDAHPVAVAEPGKNRLGEVDTMRRFIYIHGCPDDDPMGVPSSHGCIKMRNNEIIALFDLVEPGTPVDIIGHD